MDKPQNPEAQLYALEALALTRIHSPRPSPSLYIPYAAQVREYVQQQKRKLHLYKQMREALKESTNE